MKIFNLSPFRTALMAVLVVFAATAFGQKPRNVIMYIGDGYGLAPKTAARLAMGQGQPGARFSDDPNFRPLEADNLRYNTTVTTHSMNSWITDSAPGATVYAAGKKGKVHNEAVAFNMDANMPIETILEYAKKQGYAVGLVTTTRITHATPADFATHTWNRDLENELASQYISSTQAQYAAVYGTTYDSLGKHWVLPEPKRGVELDVLLGGGARQFLPKVTASANKAIVDAAGNPILDATGAAVKMAGSRTDEIDLVEIAKSRGFKYVNSRAALNGLDLNQFTPGGTAKLLGLFHASHMDYEQDRQLTYPWEPTLAEMTQIAIEVLKRKGGSKGFFLMVEGGRIDHLEHANAGGIRADNGLYSVQADKEATSADNIYLGINTPTTGIYGSDYLIKEVLAFDHAIGKGRDLLDDPSRETLIFSSSDHECGGMAIVGLHDEADLQANATKVRTYAAGPKQDAAMGAGNFTGPRGLTPGARWFPEYETYTFQGYEWPRPKSATANRIVIAYGSNPIVNGNGLTVGGTPGNHTPQDVWVGADDNVGGAFASRITGRGLLDNTDLTPIMKDFLKLDGYTTWDPNLTLGIVNTAGSWCRYQNSTFKITVKNNDPYPGERIRLKIPLPANCAYVSSTATVGAYNQYCAGGVKCETWEIPVLAPGQTAEVTLTIFPLGNTGDLVCSVSSLSANTNPVRTAGAGVPHGPCSGSNLVAEHIDGKLVFYPNPVTDMAVVHINMDETGPATMKVFDINGATVIDQPVGLVKGSNDIEVDFGGLATGSYFVSIVKNGWASEAMKVVKN